jgi:hypothetical protein
MTVVDEPVTPTNLDDVHMKAVHEMDVEPVVDDPVVDPPKVDEPVVEPPKVDEPVVTPPVVDEPVVEPPKVVELDTDITKPADGKIAIKNSDGDMNYFNNLDEVPDDFEPATYKDFLRFSGEMTEKTQLDRASARDAEVAAQKAENDKEVDAVTSSWDRDIDILTKGGVLPEDSKERETEVGDTYNYIAKKIGEGIVVDSFAEAHKAMKYEQLQEAQKIVTDNKNRVTKEKGGKVMGSEGNSKTKKIEALPAGVTLDQVHAKYSGLV